MTAQSTPDQLRFQGRSFVKFFGRPPKTNEIIASLLYRAVCGIGGEGGIRAKSRYAKRIVQCLKTARRANSRNARIGGEGGIRTHVPVTRQDAFEAPPLRPLRYLSGRVRARWSG